MKKHPTDKEKIEKYEELLHRIQCYAEVTMNSEMLKETISKICQWSYAHRVGNGCLTDEIQQELINDAFWKL